MILLSICSDVRQVVSQIYIIIYLLSEIYLFRADGISHLPPTSNLHITRCLYNIAYTVEELVVS